MSPTVGAVAASKAFAGAGAGSRAALRRFTESPTESILVLALMGGRTATNQRKIICAILLLWIYILVYEEKNLISLNH